MHHPLFAEAADAPDSGLGSGLDSVPGSGPGYGLDFEQMAAPIAVDDAD